VAYPGSSFDFSLLATPPLSSLPSLPSLLAPFDPDKVPRITFRWTRAMVIERERIVDGSYTLGPDFHPQGKYVFASDYANLLQMYHELEGLLEELRKRKK
jgi:hypothetical protein